MTAGSIKVEVPVVMRYYSPMADEERELSGSLEDYLEAILALEKEYRVARVKDIAARLSVQMPSVTSALKTLRTRGLINYEKNSFISLTEAGLEVAKSVQDKHTILTKFLETVLLLSPEAADEQACKIEHVIDIETAERAARCSDYFPGLLAGNGLDVQAWRSIILKKRR